MTKKIIEVSANVKMKEIKKFLKDMTGCEIGDTLTLRTKNQIEIILQVIK